MLQEIQEKWPLFAFTMLCGFGTALISVAPPSQPKGAGLVVNLVALVCAIGIAVSLAASFEDGVFRGFSPAVRAATLVIWGLGVSAYLWLFRRKYRLGYGLFEITIGAAALGYLAYRMPPGVLPNGLAGMTALYIIVRGLDNIDIALGLPARLPGRDAVDRVVMRWLGRGQR